MKAKPRVALKTQQSSTQIGLNKYGGADKNCHHGDEDENSMSARSVKDYREELGE